jgi:hypothetical protein
MIGGCRTCRWSFQRIPLALSRSLALMLVISSFPLPRHALLFFSSAVFVCSLCAAVGVFFRRGTFLSQPVCDCVCVSTLNATRLLIRAVPFLQSTAPRGHRFECDSCCDDIKETRFHCTKCPDLDLCSKCFKGAPGGQEPVCGHRKTCVSASYFRLDVPCCAYKNAALRGALTPSVFVLVCWRTARASATRPASAS